MDKTLQYIIDAVKLNYKYSNSTAERLVKNSSIMILLEEIPDYIQHYDADYWARKIVEDRW